MQEEIELLRSLQHPNIVTYLGTDICDENKLLYIYFLGSHDRNTTAIRIFPLFPLKARDESYHPCL